VRSFDISPGSESDQVVQFKLKCILSFGSVGRIVDRFLVGLRDWNLPIEVLFGLEGAMVTRIKF
jgi:hypothetical protein